MYYVRINGSYSFSNKLSKIEKKHIQRLAQKQYIIKFTITNKIMEIYCHRKPDCLIDFIKAVVKYMSQHPYIKYGNNIKPIYYDKKKPDGIKGCINWEHPNNTNVKEFIYVNIDWYIHLKIEKVPRLIHNINTIGNIANCYVDGRTVTVYTEGSHECMANQILNSLCNDTSRTNILLFQEIQKIFSPGVDIIVFGYAAYIDFGEIIKQIQ
jgi:hypothetical protein